MYYTKQDGSWGWWSDKKSYCSSSYSKKRASYKSNAWWNNRSYSWHDWQPRETWQWCQACGRSVAAKYDKCYCGEAMCKKDADFQDCQEGDEAEPPQSWPAEKRDKVQELIDNLSRVSGLDIQQALVCHIPLPPKT